MWTRDDSDQPEPLPLEPVFDVSHKSIGLYDPLDNTIQPTEPWIPAQIFPDLIPIIEHEDIEPARYEDVSVQMQPLHIIGNIIYNTVGEIVGIRGPGNCIEPPPRFTLLEAE